MDFNIIVDIPQPLIDMAVEVRLALGLEGQNSHLALYRRFAMAELGDEFDMELIELFKGYRPMELKIAGRMQWKEETGFLYYPVEVPPEFMALRQDLLKILPAEILLVNQVYEPHVTLGTIPTLGRNQRDVVDNLYLPQNWTINRVQLEGEVKPGRWLLEAGYTLGEG